MYPKIVGLNIIGTTKKGPPNFWKPPFGAYTQPLSGLRSAQDRHRARLSSAIGLQQAAYTNAVLDMELWSLVGAHGEYGCDTG